MLHQSSKILPLPASNSIKDFISTIIRYIVYNSTKDHSKHKRES